MLNWEDENNMTDDVQNIAKLTLNGTTYDLPVMSPTAGPDVVDIRKLYAQANVFTYDPGFTSTAACDSTITSLMERPVYCCIEAIPLISWPRKATIWKCAFCCSTVTCQMQLSSKSLKAW